MLNIFTYNSFDVNENVLFVLILKTYIYIYLL